MINCFDSHHFCIERFVQFGNGTQLKPVMVWFYGGAFFSGHSNPSLYGPDFFLEDDVVIVSFNYRIGVLGMWTYFL